MGSFVDLDQALLVLPAKHYKSDHVHIVPLVPQAVVILPAVFEAVPCSPSRFHQLSWCAHVMTSGYNLCRIG